MQYTLRNVPVPLDQALRERAERQGKSLNEVTIDALLEAFGLTREPVKRRDLSDVSGTWRDDPAIDEALRDQRRVDPDLWRCSHLPQLPVI
jgi:hypothetical protein